MEIKTVNPNVAPELSHLTTEEIDQLRLDYQQNLMKVKLIMQKYNITGFHISSLMYKIPEIVDKNTICPTCNVYSLRKIVGRNLAFGIPFCPICQKKLSSDFNPEKRIRELQNIKQRIEQKLPISFHDVIPYTIHYISAESFNILTLEQKIFFGSWVSSCIQEDLVTLCMHDIFERKICPTTEYFHQLLEQLSEIGFIPGKEHWRLKLELDKDFTKKLLNPFEEFKNTPDLYNSLWKKMNYFEVLEYYQLRMMEIRLTTTIGEKADHTINSLLDELSVGQIHSLIYYATKDACEIIVKGLYTRLHAANTVLYSCSQRRDKFLQNNWRITPFNRSNKICPQSEMSIYLFEKILQIGDQGFTHKPSFEIITASPLFKQAIAEEQDPLEEQEDEMYDFLL
jgi:hypothetical protein